MNPSRRRPCRPHGISLLEILAAVTLVGIIALVVVPRFGGHADKARVKACHVHKGNIEVQAQLWFRNKGSWPSSDLSDIGADTDYFPDGLPVCPVDDSSYTFDAGSTSVGGHEH